MLREPVWNPGGLLEPVLFSSRVLEISELGPANMCVSVRCSLKTEIVKSCLTVSHICMRQISKKLPSGVARTLFCAGNAGSESGCVPDALATTCTSAAV
jgi:hypothetical protein